MGWFFPQLGRKLYVIATNGLILHRQSQWRDIMFPKLGQRHIHPKRATTILPHAWARDWFMSAAVASEGFTFALSMFQKMEMFYYEKSQLSFFLKEIPVFWISKMRKKKQILHLIWAASSEFVSSSIPSWKILAAHISHSEGPGIWLSVWRFLLTHCLYERAAEVLLRLRGCAGSPEPLLLA